MKEQARCRWGTAWLGAGKPVTSTTHGSRAVHRAWLRVTLARRKRATRDAKARAGTSVTLARRARGAQRGTQPCSSPWLSACSQRAVGPQSASERQGVRHVYVRSPVTPGFASMRRHTAPFAHTRRGTERSSYGDVHSAPTSTTARGRRSQAATLSAITASARRVTVTWEPRTDRGYAKSLKERPRR